jgi:hypothetical protein
VPTADWRNTEEVIGKTFKVKARRLKTISEKLLA